jgi:hypothetical protein
MIRIGDPGSKNQNLISAIDKIELSVRQAIRKAFLILVSHLELMLNSLKRFVGVTRPLI